MAPKRAPLVSSAAKPRPSYGAPYQIYTEVANVGKNLEGSKKRVKWRFGWSETDQEFEVEFTHSVSGRRTIFEDGREILSTNNILGTEFSHSWNSSNTLHIFRIEASLGMSDNTYMFLIDGQRFTDMPRKPIAGKKNYSEGRYADIPESKSPPFQGNRRPSTHETEKKHTERVAAKPSSHASTFDPFENSGDDIFNNKASSASKATTFNKKHSSNDDFFATNGPTKSNTTAAAAVSIFDSFDNEPSPKVVGQQFANFDNPSKPTAGFNDFTDSFTSSNSFVSSSGATKAASSFATSDDIFSAHNSFTSATNNSVISSNAIRTPTSGNSAVSTLESSFDAFNSNKPAPKSTFDPFATTPSNAFATTPSNAFATTPSNAFATTPSNVFATTDHFDPFGSNTSTSKPGRRASAQEIVMDFTGLTITPTTTTSVEPSKSTAVQPPVAVIPEVSTTAQSEKTESPTNPDIWSSNLVNLDLTKFGERNKVSDNRPIRASLTNAGNMPIMSNIPASTGPVLGLNGKPLPVRSNPPVNPFENSLSNGGKSTSTQRGSIGPLPSDPFQALPGLSNPSFTVTAPKVETVSVPLSASLSVSNSFAPTQNSSMTNNVRMSAILASTNNNQPLNPGSTLDSLNWRSV